MPLIEIKASRPSDPNLISVMLEELRKAGSVALHCPLGNIWIVFEEISAHGFLVGDNPRFMPPVVTIKANAGRSKKEKEAVVSSISSLVGRYLSVPSDLVWIHYQEMNPADIWFQNQWAG
jgi:phenylpyruvate tautomerase PptA (4-oxalocrotonate tautomerase family)